MFRLKTNTIISLARLLSSLAIITACLVYLVWRFNILRVMQPAHAQIPWPFVDPGEQEEATEFRAGPVTFRRRLEINAGSPHFLTYNPNGKIVISGMSADGIDYWNTQTGEQLRHMSANSIAPYHIVNKQTWLHMMLAIASVSFDGKMIATGGGDGYLRLWDLQSGKERATFQAHSQPIDALKFSPVDMTLASAARDGTICLWDGTSGKRLAALEGTSSFAFSSDGKMLATMNTIGSNGGALHTQEKTQVRLWRMPTVKEEGVLNAHGFIMTFSRDGKFLVMGTNGALVIYDIALRRQRCAFPTEGTPICASWSPNGDMLAVVVQGVITNKTGIYLHIWQLSTAEEKGRMFLPEWQPVAAAFSPGWKTLVLSAFKVPPTKTTCDSRLTVYELVSSKD